MRQPMIDVYGEETFEKLWHAWVDIFLEMPKDSRGFIDLYTNVNVFCSSYIFFVILLKCFAGFEKNCMQNLDHTWR